MPKLILSIVVFLFILVLPADAQEKEKTVTSRPKIGLVLSGGGAKGLAHVGVLKVLEELDLRPDYITGVSMGAIVGGLYSIGYSAQELDSVVKAIDWNVVFGDELAFNQVGYNVKPDYRNYQINLTGNSLKEIGLPLGVVDGQLISEYFSELCWRAAGTDSFDDFPIPFRCTASDIISGKSYVFDSGSLPYAMRASMAIPTAFTPIIQDEMLLVDGGVINNFPVQECIDMGADILIGVYVGSDENSKATDFKTMVEVLSHSASFMGLVNSKKLMQKLDLKISPKIQDYGIESFGKSEEIINLGEAAAREEGVYAQLKELSDSLKKYPAKQRKELPYTKNKLPIAKIDVQGLKYVSKEFIIALSELNENTEISSQQVNDALKRMYGTLMFNKIDYHFVKDGSAFDLLFTVDEKDKIQLKSNVYYDNFFGAGLLINASYKHLLVNSSKLDLVLDISKYPRASFDYSIIGGKRKRLLYTLGLKTQSIVIPNFYEFDNSLIVSLGQFRNDQLCFNTRLAYSLTPNSSIEIKAAQMTNYFNLQGGLEDLYGIKKVTSNNFAIEASYKLNTFNHPIFPTKGVRLHVLYRKILNPQTSYTASDGLFEEISRENEIVVIDYKQFFRIQKRFSIIPEFTLGYMSSIPFYADKFFLGGSGFNTRLNTFNQAGVQPYQIATDNFLKFGLGIQQKVKDNWYLSFFAESAVFINHAETYSEESLRIDGQTIAGWVGSIAYNSVFGPLKISVSENVNNGKFYYYFTFGFPL